MTWSTIAQIKIEQDWQFTPAISPGLGYVRLTFGTAGIPVSVAQVNLDNGDLFDQREILATGYGQIFEFENPSVFVRRAIAIRLPVPATSFDVQVELSSVPIPSGSGEAIDFQPVLVGQTQILQAIDEIGLDSEISADIQSILNSQDSHSSRLIQILQRLDQPVVVDPAIVASLTTLLNGQSNQTLTLGQIQSSQNQILQALTSPAAPPQYNLITTAYTASQSSNYNTTFVGTYANLNDNSGTTGGATQSGTTSWIKATFPSAVTVRAVRVGGGNFSGWGAVAPYLNNAVLQYSTDDVNWLTLLTIAGVFDTGPNQYVLHALGQPITARFWRVLNSGFVSTSEFRFFS